MVPLMIGLAMAGPADEQAIGEVLDALHRAAAEADAPTYWGLYTQDAVFIGTDPGERWDLDAFQAYAAPHFEEAPAWAYTPHEREIHIGPRRGAAWFYETLDHARYGRVRGSGALRREGKVWRITQYVLSFPIRNEIAAEVLALGTREAGADRLPTPFTAAAIRERWTTDFRVSQRVTDTLGTSTHQTRVIEADAEGAQLGFTEYDLDGNELGSREVRVAWPQLRDHAAFPRTQTTWTDEVEVTVPAGTFTTRRYEVRTDTRVSRYWFDLSRPGPPVKMEIEEDGAPLSSMVELP